MKINVVLSILLLLVACQKPDGGHYGFNRNDPQEIEGYDDFETPEGYNVIMVPTAESQRPKVQALKRVAKEWHSRSLSIDHLESNWNVDRKRIYVKGHLKVLETESSESLNFEMAGNWNPEKGIADLMEINPGRSASQSNTDELTFRGRFLCLEIDNDANCGRAVVEVFLHKDDQVLSGQFRWESAKWKKEKEELDRQEKQDVEAQGQTLINDVIDFGPQARFEVKGASPSTVERLFERQSLPDKDAPIVDPIDQSVDDLIEKIIPGGVTGNEAILPLPPVVPEDEELKNVNGILKTDSEEINPEKAVDQTQIKAADRDQSNQSVQPKLDPRLPQVDGTEPPSNLPGDKTPTSSQRQSVVVVPEDQAKKKRIEVPKGSSTLKDWANERWDEAASIFSGTESVAPPPEKRPLGNDQHWWSPILSKGASLVERLTSKKAEQTPPKEDIQKPLVTAPPSKSSVPPVLAPSEVRTGAETKEPVVRIEPRKTQIEITAKPKTGLADEQNPSNRETLIIRQGVEAKKRASRSQEDVDKKFADQSVGTSNGGKLRNGNNLKDEVDRLGGASKVRLMYPEQRHYFGNYYSVDILLKSAILADRLRPGLLFEVSDISAERGGRLRPHRSHQNGLDMDIGFFRKSRNMGYYGDTVVQGKGLVADFDTKLQWEFFKTLMRYYSDKVYYIFVHPNVKQAMCAEAARDAREKAQSEDEKRIAFHTLRRLAPEENHYDHFHLRIKCPLKDERCDEDGDLPLKDGCVLKRR